MFRRGEGSGGHAERVGRPTFALVESRIHDSWYRELYALLSPYLVLVLRKRRIGSNGRARERKQRGRAHWGREKLREGGRRAQLFVGEIKTLLDLFGRLHFSFGP